MDFWQWTKTSNSNKRSLNIVENSKLPISWFNFKIKENSKNKHKNYDLNLFFVKRIESAKIYHPFHSEQKIDLTKVTFPL